MNAKNDVMEKLAIITAIALCTLATTACGDGDDGCAASNHFRKGWNWGFSTVDEDLRRSCTSSDPGGLAWSFDAW